MYEIKLQCTVIITKYPFKSNQANLKALIIFSISLIFIPPSSRVFKAENPCRLSFPFHKKVQIMWFSCFIMFNGVGRNEDT